MRLPRGAILDQGPPGSISFSPTPRRERGEKEAQMKKGPGSEKRSRSLSESGEARSVSLKVTSGVMAAGAWTARLEIADMLEAGVDPKTLVALIRKGEEGVELDPPPLTEGSTATTPADDEDWELIAATQRSIVEAVGGEEAMPPWARSGEKLFKPSGWVFETTEWIRQCWGKTTAAPAEFFPWRRSLLQEVQSGESTEERVWRLQTRLSYLRKEGYSSTPGILGVEAQANPGDFRDDFHPELERSAEPVAFAKRALPPPKQFRGNPPTEIGRGLLGGTRKPGISMSDREKADLKRYYSDTHAIYSFLKMRGIEMDLKSIVESGRTLDEDKFRLLTAPNRASTGLGYARLMRRLMDWNLKSSGLGVKEGSPDQVMGVLNFVIHLTQKEVGYMTPRAFLYAWEYYARAFGFVPDGPHWGRAKRLCSQYAQSKEGGVSKAPAFVKDTMVALELLVKDEKAPITHRVTAGKLRLCVQASIRHSDLQNTPLSAFEWVRRPGSQVIVGLRSKARRGKTGPRLWIAWLQGADSVGDGWLETLVKLLLQSHGSDWQRHDFTGKMPSHIQGEFSHGPSRLEVDVSTLKEALQEFKKGGSETGLSDTELAVLRWHGAKASLSSVMQHLNIPPQVVRVQGAWKNKEDAMADSYLRAAQILVLEAQERCLSYLRKGGDLPHLVGEALQSGGIPPQDTTSDKEKVSAAMDGPAFFGVKPGDLSPEFFDTAVEEDGSVKPEALAEENVTLDGKETENLLEPYSPTSPADSDDEHYVEDKDEEVPEKLDEERFQEKMDQIDTEGMVAALVQVTNPKDSSKVHLPKIDPTEQELPAVAEPRCGARGNYAYLMAEETLADSQQMCSWCVPFNKNEQKCNI